MHCGKNTYIYRTFFGYIRPIFSSQARSPIELDRNFNGGMMIDGKKACHVIPSLNGLKCKLSRLYMIGVVIGVPVHRSHLSYEVQSDRV